MYDVIIIGAGPAGSIAAHVSTRLGLKALVIDRQAPSREAMWRRTDSKVLEVVK